MFKLGATELLIILGLALLIFGPAKLPQIGRSIGNGIREMKQATKDISNTLEEEEES